MTSYTMSENTLYDMMASAFVNGAICLSNSGGIPTDRDAVIALLKRSLPVHGLRGAIAFSEAGRPDERLFEFMQMGVDDATAAGDLDSAAAMAESMNEMKMERSS